MAAPEHDPPRRIQIADGIFLFVTAPYGSAGLDGNAIAILSSDGVLVFDSNGTPAAAAAVLKNIRTLTDKPVKFVVNSHWHWDHWYGTEVYVRAFPDVQILTHEKTRAMMMGPALEFNRPGLDTQLPGYIASLEKRLASTGPDAPDAPQRRQVEQELADARFFLDQKRSTRHIFPTLTFSDSVTLHLGERTIQVLHYDRAVTPGDAFLYLQNEKVVVTGDLLVNPVSFALSCYPTGWLRTLEKIDALDAAVIVPGHGEPLHDKTLLRTTIQVMRELLREGRDAKGRGLDPDQAREEVLPRLHDAMVTMTGDTPAGNQAFRIYFVDWYLHRVYDELNGPLTDAIAPIPVK
jgi:glyoxylase-like metal-dependent hydrolase (beta-lactamase superfamily II)